METSQEQDRVAERTRRRRFLIPLGIVVSIAFVAMFVVNIVRERIKDDAVRANLESITAQARIFHAAYGSYSDRVAEDCGEGVFSDPTIQAALIAIRLANGRGEEKCVSEYDEFFLAVSRPSRGFYRPDSTYWCADAEGKVCPLDSLSGISESCTCP